MNAILVFDPSNDLLFAKSNKLFRLQVLKYSKLNGLILGSPIVDDSTATATATATATTTSASTETPSSVSGSSPSPSASPPPSPLSPPPPPPPNYATNCSSSPAPAPPLTNVATAHARPVVSPQPHKPASAQRPPRRQRQPSVASSTLGGRPPVLAPDGGSGRLCRRRSQRAPPGSLASGPGGPRETANACRKLPDDTNKRYLEVLMLLLTPYVASLRLSSSVGNQQQQQEQQQQRKQVAQSDDARREANADSRDPMDPGEEEDLLNKFFSSININHECKAEQEIDHSSSKRSLPAENAHSTGEFSPRRFASIPLPVKCLENCQIVYCELYDFIFIYMQELEQVSSFKMRLLQKRIDLFARLALILFGPSLNSLRQQQHQNDHSSSDSATPNHVVQSQILRLVYDVWLDNQFEASFLLEAQERLIVSKMIEKLCLETLHKVSVHLRRPVNVGAGCSEIHMHSILYSGSKLVSSFSCRNSQPINGDDLVLLLLLLKTFNLHHDNELVVDSDATIGDRVAEAFMACDDIDDATAKQQFFTAGAQEAPDYCYASNYNANRHTYEINSTTTTNSSLPTSRKSRPRTGSTAGRPNRSLGKENHHHETEVGHKIPSQFLVFLSTGGKFKERLRVPHMIRFVPLTGGITLMLISEISTSFLSLQLNRILKILLDISRQSSIADLKLNQLARINDCVCAIKTYFYGPNYQFRSSQNQRRLSQRSAASTNPRRSHPETSQNFDSRGVPLDESQPLAETSEQTGQQHVAAAKGSTWSMSNLFGKYLRNSTTKQPEDDDESSGDSSLFDSLQGVERRQCCQLMSRLEDLVSNNIHTYMKKTFNLPVDERKREALIGSAAAILRDSMNTFVVAPQLAKLNDLNGTYLRQLDQTLDEVKLMAREELSDYLDYLAVKSSCNITLGAPITHDMPAIKSFIYVDRSRQELLVSPLKPSATKMDRQTVLEANFCDSLLGGRRDSDGQQDAEVAEEPPSYGTDSSELDSSDESRADEADCESDLGESDSSAAPPTSTLSSSGSGFNLREELGRNKLAASASGRQLRTGSGAATTADSRWRLGASGDLLIEGRSPSSSGRSLATNNSCSSWASDTQMLAPRDHHDQLSTEEMLRDLAFGSARESKQHNHLVDENLMKGFTCFVYNRLANGRTSYTSNDGTYVYSYFLWFKRNSGGVIKVEPNRKSETAKRLAANYDSLPSVVCDDFFNSYANCLFGQKPAASRNPQKLPGRNQMRIACQISQMDKSHGGRLVRQHLTQVKEEDDEDEEDLVDYQRSMLDDTDNTVGQSGSSSWRSSGGRHENQEDGDFHMFFRSQMSGRTGRSKVRIYQGSRGTPVKQRQPQPPQPGERGGSGRLEAPKCYELFCVHHASLLVHRSQILVEAERLARRLAQLTE